MVPEDDMRRSNDLNGTKNLHWKRVKRKEKYGGYEEMPRPMLNKQIPKKKNKKKKMETATEFMYLHHSKIL